MYQSEPYNKTMDIAGKKESMKLAAEELKKIVEENETDVVSEIVIIISDLTWLGFRIARCTLRGSSYQQCANKLGVTKEKVRYYHEKCVELQHDITLKKLFILK